MTKVTKISLLAGLTLLGASSLMISSQQLIAKQKDAIAEQASSAAKSPSISVMVQTIIDDKAVFATVRSSDTAVARARLSGVVVSLTVDEGSQVKRGEAIGKIVDKKLKLKMASLDARLKAAKARSSKAQKDLTRGKSLKRKGVIAIAKVDQLRAAYDIAANDEKAAAAERSVLREQMKQGVVLAPADGRVLKVSTTIGSVVLAGESLAVIAANRYILRLELPERHARFIKKNDSVMVGARGLDPLEKAIGRGVITQVYPELKNGRVIADVEIDHLGNYFVGERALVRIAADKRQAIVIPGEYSFKRYGLDYVKLAQSNSKPIEVIVQLGGKVVLGKGNGGIEVLAGLKAGDRLVRP